MKALFLCFHMFLCAYVIGQGSFILESKPLSCFDKSVFLFKESQKAILHDIKGGKQTTIHFNIDVKNQHFVVIEKEIVNALDPKHYGLAVLSNGDRYEWSVKNDQTIVHYLVNGENIRVFNTFEYSPKGKIVEKMIYNKGTEFKEIEPKLDAIIAATNQPSLKDYAKKNNLKTKHAADLKKILAYLDTLSN